jgi:hypothetical protein
MVRALVQRGNDETEEKDDEIRYSLLDPATTTLNTTTTSSSSLTSEWPLAIHALTGRLRLLRQLDHEQQGGGVEAVVVPLVATHSSSGSRAFALLRLIVLVLIFFVFNYFIFSKMQFLFTNKPFFIFYLLFISSLVINIER